MATSALTDLAALCLADLRAWLAWRHAQDFARSSTARAVAGVRSFFRFVDRRHGIHNPALQAMRTPRLPHRLPRPLVEEDARDLITSARIEAREPWLGYRDTALLMLLYGGGLRIGEALRLNRRDIGVDPRGLRGLRVLGKGNKERLVPILPIVAEAVAAYLAACPSPPLPDEPLFKGSRGARLQQGVVQRQVRQLRVSLGLPDTATPHALRHSFADPPARRRGRSAGDPGAARPCQPVDDARLHRGRQPPAGEPLRPRPSTSVTAGTAGAVS